jgi:hypothetical protein
VVTPEELYAQAIELHDACGRRDQRLPISDTEIIAEAPTHSTRGPSVLVLMRSMRRRTDARGRDRLATYFLQGATVGPEGRRDACTNALLIQGETLPLVAEMFARAMQIEIAELGRRGTDPRPAAPAEGRVTP